MREGSLMFRFLFRATLVAAILTWSSSLGHAAGLLLYETGAPDLGTASAGRAAMGADASTAGANPAAMTLLDRSQLMIASGALLPVTNFHVGSQTAVLGGGQGGGNAGVFMPIGAGFYVHRLSERWWVGAAFTSQFGLAADFGKQWVGRYYVTRESLLTGQLNPTLAYRVNRWLSVGAGFTVIGGRLYSQAKINTLRPQLPDGNLQFESWDFEVGGNVGLLIEPLPKLRFGLTYQSPVDFTFGFNPHTSALGPGFQRILKRTGITSTKLDLGITKPQEMMASAFYQLTPALALMGNVGWQNWSAFGQTTLGISSKMQKTLAVNMHFADTMQLAIGGQYRIAERWLLSAGFAYDSSPVSEANRVPTLPLDRNLRYGTGIQYEINRDVTLGIANEVLDAGNGPYNVRRGPLAGRVQGDFSTNLLDFLALNLIWKF
jgi:long-chain fatty acid transport protein